MHLRACVRSLGWMASDVLNLLWPMQERAVSRAQAAFDAFEENNETWPGQEADVRAFTISSLFEWMRREGRTDITVQCGHCMETVGDAKAFAVHMLTCDLQPKSSAGSAVSAASTQPPGVDGPGEVEQPPKAPSPGHSSTVDWLIPAITDVLASHWPDYRIGIVRCCPDLSTAAPNADLQDWREHAGRLIAERVVESLAAQPK